MTHGGKSRQVIEKNGGASRARTDDLIVANDALSQLSYSPTQWWDCFFDFTSRHSISPIYGICNRVRRAVEHSKR
jgi:hypothetical protein